MRLLNVSLRGRVDAFLSAEPVIVDFDSLGAGLVALVGGNGEGKTSILEAAANALYRAHPSRPGWYENWQGRDAFVEAVFADGAHEVKVRVQVDAERRTTEGYVFLDGMSLTTGRAAEFEAEVERRFGSYALFLSSVFASQNKAGSFLDMKKADRKSLFVELLGLGALEVLAGEARERETSARGKLDRARQAVADVQAEVADLMVRQMELGEATAQADRAAGALDAARQEEAAALAQLERAKGAAERLTQLVNAEAAAARELAAADKALADAKALPGKAQAAHDTALRFLAARKVEEMAPAAHRRHQAAVNAIEDRRVRLNAQLADVPDLDKAREDLNATLAERGFLDHDETEAVRLETAALRAEAAAMSAGEALKVAAEAHTREVARLTRQAGMMEQAPCTKYPTWNEAPVGAGAYDLAGTCPLLADARQATAALAALLAPSKDAWLAALGAAGNARKLADAAKNPARAEQIDVLKTLETVHRRSIAQAEAAIHARQQLDALETERVEVERVLGREIESARMAAHDLEAQKAIARQDLAVATVQADKRIADAAGAAEDARWRHADTVEALASEKDTPSIEKTRAALASAMCTRKDAEALIERAITTRAGLAAKVEALEAKAAALPALNQAVTDAERQVGDWSLLARALGKDGAQALEIDAAGPEVAKLTNELLAVYPGQSFAISFETLREKKSARGEYSEAFDVRVFHDGREKAVEALSGGERVVIAEAIGLGISIYNAHKSGIRWETMFRDETAGALDPSAAQAYVLMLRRARELAGAHQVIFVSHSEAVWEAADVRLVVAGGRVSVDGVRAAA